MGYGSDLTIGLFSKQCSIFNKEIDVANTLLARDYKGFGNQSMNGVINAYKEKDWKVSPYRCRGGQKGWIYSVDGIVGALPASQYKDPFKILIKKKDENGENTTVR